MTNALYISLIDSAANLIIVAVGGYVARKVMAVRRDVHQFLTDHDKLMETTAAHGDAIIKLNARLDALAKRRGQVGSNHSDMPG